MGVRVIERVICFNICEWFLFRLGDVLAVGVCSTVVGAVHASAVIADGVLDVSAT